MLVDERRIPQAGFRWSMTVKEVLDYCADA